MGIEKIFPKFSSFLPGGLGQNMGEMQSKFFQQRGFIKKETEIKSEELRKDYKQRKKTAIIGECIRDIPALSFLYFGGSEIALAYYALATWFEDRWAYFMGCVGC